MTREMLMDAVSALDSEALDEALCERARLMPRASRRIKPLAVKRMGIAACFLAVLLVLPYARLVFSGSNETAPDIRFFTSAAEAEAALGEGLLLDRLEDSPAHTRDIRVTYASEYYAAEGDVNPSLSGGGVDKPLMLVATYTVSDTTCGTTGGITSEPLPVMPVETSAEQDPVYDGPSAEDSPTPDDLPAKDENPSVEWEDEEGAAASMKLYIMFDCDSVEDSRIGGYEEQGLTQWYGDIAVHYSVIRDPQPHGQAKFLYGGDLYVLDVVSPEADQMLFRYLDLLLREEGIA